MKDELWWSPGQIRFRWEQVEWLLSHYTLISEGQWPPEPKNSGYAEIAGVVNLAKKTKRRRWAYFETPIDIAAELDERMRLIGEDSSVLRDLYITGYSDEEAARMRGITEDTLRRRHNRAMRLMTGWRRKGVEDRSKMSNRKYKGLAGLSPPARLANRLGLDLHCCSSCGWQGLCDIHHKNGDTKNNTGENLLIVCPNCHRSIHLSGVPFGVCGA